MEKLNWDIIAGHEAQQAELRAMLRERRLPHALLFVGEKGIGKKLCGRVLAAAILCGQESPCGHCENCRAMNLGSHPDYFELVPEAKGKAAPIIHIEEMRSMQVMVSRSAVQAGRRVVLIDDAEAMNEAAANSLLKTLEEPAGEVTFILIARARSALLDTIVSRCIPLSFGMLPAETVAAVLQKQGIAPDMAGKLASLADGSIGRALKLHADGGLELRDKALAFLLGLPELQLTKLWQEAAAMGEWDKQRLTEWAAYFNMLLRDLLVLYSAGDSQLLYHRDLRGRLAEFLPAFTQRQLFAMAAETREFTRRLQSNVNLRLQLEGFFIRLLDCR